MESVERICFTAKLLRSPSDGDAMRVACLSVLCEGRAQTLAVTAHIASARIQHAPIMQENTHKLVVSHFFFFPPKIVQLFFLFLKWKPPPSHLGKTYCV